MPTPPTSSPNTEGVASTRSLRSRRVRALLASGLVLGVGAAMTLASWNDSEYAGGSIEAGSFGLEGMAQGDQEFTQGPADNPHSLSFSVAENLFPGATTYAAMSVRTQDGSLGGTVQVLADDTNAEGLGAYLTYGIRDIGDATCNEDSFHGDEATNVVPPGTALTEGASADNVQTLAPNAASTVNYCLELTLPGDASNDAQGETAAPRWEFLGTSVSE